MYASLVYSAINLIIDSNCIHMANRQSTKLHEEDSIKLGYNYSSQFIIENVQKDLALSTEQSIV